MSDDDTRLDAAPERPVDPTSPPPGAPRVVQLDHQPPLTAGDRATHCEGCLKPYDPTGPPHQTSFSLVDPGPPARWVHASCELAFLRRSTNLICPLCGQGDEDLLLEVATTERDQPPSLLSWYLFHVCSCGTVFRLLVDNRCEVYSLPDRTYSAQEVLAARLGTDPRLLSR